MLNEKTNDNAVEEVDNSENAENNTSVEEDTPTVEQIDTKDYLSNYYNYPSLIEILKFRFKIR